MRPDINRLALFVNVAQAGGFTAAADRLGVAKSMVSQQIAQLEAELGVALFARTTRRVTLTEAGETLLSQCEPLLSALLDAVSDIGSGTAVLRGRLKITAPSDYAARVLAPVLARFALKHPDLQLELLATDQQIDLVAEGVDLALRMGALADSNLRAARLGQFAQVPVASPDLVQRVGRPTAPEALADMPWLALTALRAPLSWRFTGQTGQVCAVRLKSVFRANSTGVLLEMARAGLGGVVLPDYMLADDIARGTLIHLVPTWQLPMGGIYVVYPAVRQVPVKVRMLIDHLRQYFT
ncbi:DNA-binding transcriptional LysR family regulator [Chitinivorax tropicus]|uniref:DNA-binding transcriptional LysR family regulator n=1 Tax=Chitinivorax tropicus TaxID=714531 RepID=A0A840MQJ1_9PROT|nr:LysR family transcriptional regulator [Chitinivorax tropicus]MBB5018443.1 DNA-binding transcriptional LysR family regulator [Chitinivorax tropicus]